MRKLSTIVVIATAAGCMSENMVDVFSEEEFEQIKKLGPLGQVPSDPTIRFADDALVETFGLRLFFE